jgi:hypothetical protein
MSLLANAADKVLLWIHGRRLGLIGDGQGGSSSALVVDNVIVASTRSDIVLTHLGHNGAGAVAVAGTVVGDNVVNVTNLSTPGDVTASFESTVTVAGQVQQTAATDLSAAQLLFSVQPQS